ncbi:roadblock/LC7 domain-containing protein [Actinoplanes sp. NPDC051470]|uniref:roadblock/LC7 domain-containing protein n=1 Tax=unclassified Actinoplanes TaxID=2626549 RepID=UPI003433F564
MDSTSHNDLTWMLDELAAFPSVLNAAVLSTDGLIIQRSTSLPQDAADLMAAAASSLYSVAAGTGRRFKSGPVHQVVIEYEDHTLFIAAAGENARLAVLCGEDVDMGAIAYEMGRLVTRIGQYLGAEARAKAAAGNGHAGG